MQLLDDTHEGQLRRWCGGPPSPTAPDHFMVLRIYSGEYSGHFFVDILEGNHVYRAFNLSGMLQLSEPVT